MWRDFRYAIRSLHRDSRLSTIIILVIGLGVGANTAIFSLINGVLLRPLPFERPDRLVFLWETAPYLGLAQSEASLPNFLDWQRDARFFEDMAAARAWSYNLTGAGEPQKLDGAAVTGNLFSILGVAPAHGRLFQASEQQPGSERVVVLSYDLWQTTFGGDVGAIGRDITLNDMQYTVVGVMPRGFQFPRQRTDLWAPAVFPDFLKRARGPKFLVPVGRLRDGVTVQAAQSELTAIAQRLAKAYPRSNADTSVRLEPIAEEYVGDVRKPYGVLLAAAGLVLLIVCANVANLFLVRAANHRKETAVHVALGAGRAHLIRQRLAESLLLSSAGSALGLLFAVWTSGFLVRLVPVELSRWAGVGIDWRVLGFALALTLLTSITFSVGLAMDGVRLTCTTR